MNEATGAYSDVRHLDALNNLEYAAGALFLAIQGAETVGGDDGDILGQMAFRLREEIEAIGKAFDTERKRRAGS